MKYVKTFKEFNEENLYEGKLNKKLHEKETFNEEKKVKYASLSTGELEDRLMKYSKALKGVQKPYDDIEQSVADAKMKVHKELQRRDAY